MESKVVKTGETNLNQKLWIFTPSGNIWLRIKDFLVCIHAESKGLDIGATVTNPEEALKNGSFRPFHGTIELKE